MNSDKKSTLPQSNTSSAEQEKAPIFHVQTGLKAGFQDDNPYNDRARAAGFAQGSVNFLRDFFS